MERNRRVAKAYARAPILSINGSDVGFDGYRIGLNGFLNPKRDAKTEDIKRFIGSVYNKTFLVFAHFNKNEFNFSKNELNDKN